MNTDRKDCIGVLIIRYILMTKHKIVAYCCIWLVLSKDLQADWLNTYFKICVELTHELHWLGFHTLYILVPVFGTQAYSWLDWCNSILFGTSTKIINKLLYIQNSAACLLYSVDHTHQQNQISPFVPKGTWEDSACYLVPFVTVWKWEPPLQN